MQFLEAMEMAKKQIGIDKIFISNADSGDEIVISGISGSFASSKNIEEFRKKLFNKVQMVSSKGRWGKFNHPEMPKNIGLISDIEKFDAGFFGIHERQSQSLDPMIRILLEKVTEAILDAGLHPSDLGGTRTGVYVGNCFSETELVLMSNENLKSQSYAWTGYSKSMQAHRVSYFFKLKGPSIGIDTACSSSLCALEHAFRAIMLDEIDNAIVCGANVILAPFGTLQFARLGLLNNDGGCKVFDKSANGYVRSEAIGALLLQKSNIARRVYAQMIYAKMNCDGYKEQGITFPSAEAQADLLKTFYKECNINNSSLSFLEAHGTGTPVGDPEECSAIDSVLTQNRNTPLPIGSVKSNVGHTEAASGVCSVIKCIIGMEAGFIPPNINFSAPNKNIKGIVEGRMNVVTEKMRISDNAGLVGVNGFGFGGANCHVLLRWNTKKKINNGLPDDDIPRLVCISGRTEDASTALLNELSQKKLDIEHIDLLHNIFRLILL